MANEPKPKAFRKTKRRSASEAVVQYVVAIDGWGCRYTLLLNDDKRPVDPYHEFRHLQKIAGRLLRPAGLKTERVEIALLPTSNISEEKRKGCEPIALGSLDALPGIIRGSIGIPADALPPILTIGAPPR